MNKVIRFLWSKIGKSKALFRVLCFLFLAGGAAAGWLGYDRSKADRSQDRAAETAVASSHGERPADTGHIRVYFTHPGGSPETSDDLLRALADNIDRAERTLDVCAFELENSVITEVLARAARRGVKVRLVTESSSLPQSGIAVLRAAGVPVVDDGQEGIMHNSFLVFDDRAVWTGSMNFGESCASRSHTNALYVEDPELAANYATKFRWMFEQHSFGGPPNPADRIPHPTVTLRDGSRIDACFSTHDRLADRLIERIAQAKSSIHFLAFGFTHAGIARAMLERARAGIPVQGVFDRNQTSNGPSEYSKFFTAGPGVQVCLDADGRSMHHQVILIDGEAVATGSFPFTEKTDKENDENVVIVYSRKVAQQFEEEFFRLYDAARKTGSGVAVMTPRLRK